MSDAPQGPGWWQASDDKWYPPPRPDMPGDDEAAMAGTSAPSAGLAPPAGPPVGPSGPPAGFPSGTGFAPAAGPSGPGFGPPGAPGAPMTGPFGAPGGPPPGGGQNRTPLFVALAVVVVLVVIGIAVLASGGGDDSDDDPIAQQELDTDATSGPNVTASDATVADPTTDDTEADDTETGSGGAIDDIEVTDSGVTNFADEFDGTNRASYAYVLTNNGDGPVANMEVTVTLIDAEETVLSSDTDSIYLLQPGQSIGLGDTTYDEIAEVASVEVQPAIPSYASAAEALGEVTIEGINTTTDSSGYLTTTFTATSTYEVQLDSPWAYIVYRNAEGDIVGGAYSVIDIVQPGGSTSGEVASYTAVPDVDPAQTEVYVDPGYL